MSKTKLIISALTKYIAGLLMVTLMLFLPSGTWKYFNGWLFIGLLFVPMFVLGVVLLIKSPELLEKRLRSKESESDQKKVIGASLVMFLAGFILSALDYRFGWTYVPFPVVIAAAVILLVSYGLYAEVMRENVYLSRTVEVQEEQKVIDTGLYGIVRHPMYFSTVLLFLSIPVVLGSWIGFVIFCIYPFLLVKRIRNEESVLEEGLAGYKEYKKKVKYRMIPFVW
ncbi:MAG: isoprenylcysteine carboxylmethyltransferase family protein [Lachnospiraceae bacterium]|nr:isoprenylcysteine carboxylmethyltransferase family protein [Lachnospiraceae bacterium]